MLGNIEKVSIFQIIVFFEIGLISDEAKIILENNLIPTFLPQHSNLRHHHFLCVMGLKGSPCIHSAGDGE